jgi:hypothetical protein
LAGSLNELIDRARRREIDVAPVSVSAISAAFRTGRHRRRARAQELADFLRRPLGWWH